jgi:16S rRNA (cytosine1402-N4)-methyltransferase
VTDKADHTSVLLKEVIVGLNIKANGIYIDGTFGRGGHSLAILEQLNEEGRLYALDKDQAAIAAGKAITDKRFHLQQGSFAEIEKWAKHWGILGKVDGVLLDLGVSSPQLDDATRGFSFLRDGPLDMRMDVEQELTAAQWLAVATEEEMTKVFKEYGEEAYGRAIARAIIAERLERPLQTTKQLADLVSAMVPQGKQWRMTKHPATRIFQAIRIYINRELEALEGFLQQILPVLAVNGCMAIISFHSLEDRLVKRFIQQGAKGDPYPRDLPIRGAEVAPGIEKGIVSRASAAEIHHNPRARSAVLRVMRKIK